MSALTRWARWEFARTIDMTPFIRFIIVERFVKGGLLVAGGFALLVAGQETDLHRLAANIQDQLDLTSGDSLLRRAVGYVLEHLGGLSDRGRNELAVGVLLYGSLELFEGIGLLRRRRWAEYLVLVATGAFLPLELAELAKHISVLKVGALMLNVAIIVYMVVRKRLFLESPDDRGPEPA